MTPFAEGLAFPEGPVLLPDGTLAVVELAAGRVTHIAANGTIRTIATTGGSPNGAALGPDGHLYVCNSGGYDFIRTRDGRLRPCAIADTYQGGRIERINLGNGAAETLYDRCDGIHLNAPNDIVFDHNANFWFTDYGHQRGRAHDLGAVYYASADGSAIREVAFPLITPNGVGLAPDGQIVYISETMTGALRRYRRSDASGGLQPLRWPRQIQPEFALVAPPRYDSMAIEANGFLAIARLGAGSIVVVSPDGAMIEEHSFPDPFVTNICFGGPDMCDAYVTLSSKGVIARQRWPRPGLLLRH